MKTKYMGCVTDINYTKAMLKLNQIERQRIVKKERYNKKLEEGLQFIFSCKRMPRVYQDEL